MKYQHKKIIPLITSLLSVIGEDIHREGLRKTPHRVAKSFEKLFGGYNEDPKKIITVFHNEGYNEMVVAHDIDFYSLCEHHILPFYGRAYIGYIPDTHIIGISKLPRLVDLFARRLQNQERLTRQIATTLATTLKPKGVGVVIKAEHLCIKLRGVEKQNCMVSTSSFTGLFKEDARTRDEFLHLIKK